MTKHGMEEKNNSSSINAKNSYIILPEHMRFCKMEKKRKGKIKFKRRKKNRSCTVGWVSVVLEWVSTGNGLD